MKKELLLFFLLAKCSLSFSQDVLIDTITGEIKSEIPFDREFHLPVKHKKQEVIEYVIITKKRNGVPSSFSNLEISRAQLVYGKRASRGVNNKSEITVNLEGSGGVFPTEKKEFSKVKIFPLAPSTGYEFRLVFSDFSYSKKKRKLFTEAINYLNTNPLAENDQDIIKEKIKEFTKDGDNLKAMAYIVHLKSITNPKYKLLENLNSDIKTISKIKITNVDFSFFVDCYSEILENISTCDSCSFATRLIIKEISKGGSLVHVGNEFLNDVSEGLYSITDSEISAKADVNDYSKRISNLKSTYRYILTLSKIQSFSFVNFPSDILLSEIKGKIDDLNSLKNSWEALLKKYSSSAIILNLDAFHPEKVIGYTGGATTLKSKGKFRVRPDFGVSLATDGTFSRVMPFAGVRLNLRPLDPNLPYNQIMKKSFAHRSSFGIGFTLNSIADGSTRFDLFGKTNLILDYGFRLNNAFTVNIGTMVFKREDPNPFISGQKLAFLPTIGLSLDFEIIEAISDVKKVLTTK